MSIKNEPGQSDPEALAPKASMGKDMVEESAHHDAVFGEISDEGPNYRNVGWLGTVALMMKTQIGLGVLSIPAAFDTLGLVPGVICLLAVAGITTWSNYIVGTFKLRHRQVYGIDDAGAMMFGRVGREFFSVAFCLYWIFAAGSGIIGTSIGLNAVSTHGTCTAAFVAVAAIAAFLLASVRTLGSMSWIAWVGLCSIMIAVFTVTVSVGVQDRPADAPRDGLWRSDYKITNDPPFWKTISAVATIIFAYAGTGAFFSIAAEMRDPRYYTRALLICQGGVTATYLTVGVVVYYFCGSYVASPALGSAGALMKKVCYGIALPGILVSTVLVIHFSAKYIFVRTLRGSPHLTSGSLIHWVAWLSCTAGVTVIAYLIASGIPVFGGLVSLIGALLGTLMSFQPMGCMWLYDNWTEGRKNPTARWGAMVAWSVFVVLSGSFLMIAGTYGSIVGIINSPDRTASWSCSDNSNSV
ncbi:hypothetical protein FSST1_006478 [Fusarium sambucinum]